MSSAALRVLWVRGPGAVLPAVASSSPFGPFELHPSADLDEAAKRLAADRFDAVVIAARTVDARKLLTWPALTQAASEPALLVLTSDEPGAELATLLVRKGAQDVLPLAIDAVDALPRAIRLAIERKSQERLARKAFATDLMTGLPNQGQLIEHMNQLIALREREPAPMALLAVRVEGLGSTETRLGSEAANVLRRKIAVRLRVGVRASDLVASLGTDAFAVLLPRFQDPQDADRVAAKLCSALHPPFTMAGRHVSIAVACGVARYPDDGKDAAGLLRRAVGLAASAPAQGRADGSAADAANDPG
ncbi:diguanylate cyclase [Piscinibacter sp. XHJ-5]|uniref:diguanylate cyclase domain-containing protein n=1 Tax=Piscinibacter sp. XHJ-5 TaxID=3037797 RepID=UPI002453077F|nr:diguanylate cyclase [Piscinibacter sp. XHJ-5]